MKKVLFISFQDFHNIFDGGSLANRRNVEMAVNVLGKENVDCFSSTTTERKTVLFQCCSQQYSFLSAIFTD